MVGFGSGNVSGFPSVSSELQELPHSLGATLEEKQRGFWLLSQAGGAGWTDRLWVPMGTAHPSPCSITSEVPKTPIVPQEQVRNHLPYTATAFHHLAQKKTHPKPMAWGRKEGPLMGDEPTHDHSFSPICFVLRQNKGNKLGIGELGVIFDFSVCSRAGVLNTFSRQIPWQASSTHVHHFLKM